MEEANVGNSLVATMGADRKPVLHLKGRALGGATQIVALRSKQLPGVEFRYRMEIFTLGGIAGRRLFIDGVCYTVHSANLGLAFDGAIYEVTYDPNTNTISDKIS